MLGQDLRDLFTLRAHSRSDTFDSMCADDDDAALCSQEDGTDSRAGASDEEVNKDQAGPSAIQSALPSSCLERRQPSRDGHPL